MSNNAIIVSNISKKYELGSISSGTLSTDLNKWWAKLRGKADPTAVIGEYNEGTEYWALRDVSFDIQQGDTVGIIGKNGAGKSTLLKILSRVTAPTQGTIKIKGRVASLLEVGTGFHPDLSGRENIYMNGAILGMLRSEITSKLDEIIAFSGVEKHIDTPVKRYSSGMYVRLAFAVAAHLEPEILIVDEVLAVGDAEFQKKCLGKMNEVSQQGRTVLFVSHNMGAVKNLCKKGILLKKGSVASLGPINSVVDAYTDTEHVNQSTYNLLSLKRVNDQAYFTEIQFEDEHGKPSALLPTCRPWQVRLKFRVETKLPNFIVGMGIVSKDDLPIRTVWAPPTEINEGEYELLFRDEAVFLTAGQYYISLGLSSRGQSIQYLPSCVSIEWEDYVDKDIALNTKSGLLLNPMKSNLIKL